jgi:hypothetical protein
VSLDKKVFFGIYSQKMSTHIPLEVHRGKSLDNIPFELETFDLDVLLDTASNSSFTIAVSSDDDDNDDENEEYFDFFENMESLEALETLPTITTTMVPTKIPEEMSLFSSMLSLLRSDTPTADVRRSFLPSTPPTRTRSIQHRQHQQQQHQHEQKNQEKLQGKSTGSKQIPVVDPKRIEARLASQRYRDTKTNEYNFLMSQHQKLLRENHELRNRYSLPPLNLATIPGCEPIPTTWKRAETRKERNRQAAKRSREAAKRKHQVLATKNAYLLKDSTVLKQEFNELQVFEEDYNEFDEFEGIVDGFEVFEDFAEVAEVAEILNNKKRSIENKSNPSKKRIKSQKSSPFNMNESYLLLLAVALCILGCVVQTFDGSSDSLHLHAGMDLRTGIMQHLALGYQHLIAAGIVCVGSAMHIYAGIPLNERKDDITQTHTHIS